MQSGARAVLAKSVLLISLLAASASAHAIGFGVPSAPSRPVPPSMPQSSGGATAADIDAFLLNAQEAELLMRSSARHIARAVLAKEEYQPLEDKYAAADKIQDPKEKEAQNRKIDEEEQTKLKGHFESPASKADDEKMKRLDKTQKEQTGYAIFNFVLGTLKDAELVIRGKNLTAGTPSPTVAPKLPAVTAVVASLGGQADKVQRIGQGVSKLSASADLKELPTKSSDKPKPLAL